MGSSTAYTVGLLNALYAYGGHLAGAERLARQACEIEIGRCNRPIGKQDQYIAAYGGLKSITFNPDGTVFVDPILCVPATRRQLEERLLLLYTGQTRRAETILEEQTRNSTDNEATRVRLRRMAGFAEQIPEALNSNELDGIGDILHANWEDKRLLATGISNPKLDASYRAARAHGAIGGKILGAGGGGFLLLYAPKERHREICATLPELRPVPFSFEPQGSKLIYIEENQHQQYGPTRKSKVEGPSPNLRTALAAHSPRSGRRNVGL